MSAAGLRAAARDRVEPAWNCHLEVHHSRCYTLDDIRDGRRVRVEQFTITVVARSSGAVAPALDRFIRNQRQHPASSFLFLIRILRIGRSLGARLGHRPRSDPRPSEQRQRQKRERDERQRLRKWCQIGAGKKPQRGDPE